MAVKAAPDLNYPDVFVALGKFIADKNLQDLCIMEFEQGFIVSGYSVYEGHAGSRRAQETFILSVEELKKMSSGKRGLFG
jgi:hypothetical protein